MAIISNEKKKSKSYCQKEMIKKKDQEKKLRTRI